MSEAKTNVFISFSFKSSNDRKEKYEKILNQSNYAVNYSEKVDKSEYSNETIWKSLKNKISGSSVMIVIYSKDFEKGKGGKAMKTKDSCLSNDPFQNQGWIYKELRCGLRNSHNNNINGIIVVMPDEIYNEMYINSYCPKNNSKRINLNYDAYPPILKNNYGNKKYWKPSCGCCFCILEDSYIPIIKESEFLKDTSKYIKLVKEKRDNKDKYNIKRETD